MAWTYSVESEEYPSLSKSMSSQSLTVKLMDFADEFCINNLPIKTYGEHQFGMTLKHLMHQTFKKISTSYMAVSLVKISQLQALEKAWRESEADFFFEIMRLAKQIKPKFIFIENVPAITTRGGLRVVKEIASMGYDCRWCVISAASVGALHKRERWFLLGYSNSFTSKQADSNPFTLTCEEATWRRSPRQYWPYESRAHWQEVVSTVRRVTDGVPYGLDRLRALGNAVVPQQTLAAFELLLGII